MSVKISGYCLFAREEIAKGERTKYYKMGDFIKATDRKWSALSRKEKDWYLLVTDKINNGTPMVSVT
jgi:hypothetical protein